MHLSFFFLPDFYKAPSLFISPLRDRGWVYAGSASDGCLGCCPALFLPRALLMDALLCYVILLFCPAVLCQYGLANRLWLTGDCVG